MIQITDSETDIAVRALAHEHGHSQNAVACALVRLGLRTLEKTPDALLPALREYRERKPLGRPVIAPESKPAEPKRHTSRKLEPWNAK